MIIPHVFNYFFFMFIISNNGRYIVQKDGGGGMVPLPPCSTVPQSISAGLSRQPQELSLVRRIHQSIYCMSGERKDKKRRDQIALECD